MESIKSFEIVSEPQTPLAVIWTKQFISKKDLIKMIQKTLSIPDNAMISLDENDDSMIVSYAVKVDL